MVCTTVDRDVPDVTIAERGPPIVGTSGSAHRDRGLVQVPDGDVVLASAWNRRVGWKSWTFPTCGDESWGQHTPRDRQQVGGGSSHFLQHRHRQEFRGNREVRPVSALLFLRTSGRNVCF